jgi:hypothetical protein
MKRFPNYKGVTKYEKKLLKDSIPIKLLLNYIIQILRRYEVANRFNVISDIKKEFSRNPRIEYLDFSEKIIMTIIEDHPKIFDRKNIRNEDEIFTMIKTSSTIWEYESRGLNFDHYKHYGTYYGILKVNIIYIIIQMLIFYLRTIQ